ncbi:MAG: carbonic anhydrase family protein [Thiohalocapsa sp.]|jgi:carbonic anhydrase|uniref:carbonic anhydrase n=1 Tax=Thiohalocapsa sp. TaxID=2497641 RepID=UPI0025E862D9|nr:carbonic anhydrase family protein [Thiohalocapsa sp.]MCG6940186.1 carbonic anhydrase family protein [Thiohalocapsa sp.]
MALAQLAAQALPGALAVAGLLLCAAPAAAWQPGVSLPDPDAMPQWAYSGAKGPERWADLDPDYGTCGRGDHQSPVALTEAVAVAAPCEPLRFRYRSSALYVTNDGRALRLGYDRGSYLVVDGLSYELVELRFHVPSEHVIDGHTADAELQLIHANNRGDIAVVAVPLIAGPRVNQILRRVLENAPSRPGQSFYGRNVGVNPLFMLPGRKDYYAYEGSLTRPPCTEGVHWFVMRTPVEVAAVDLNRLASLVGRNARPLQRLGNRRVAMVCTP